MIDWFQILLLLLGGAVGFYFWWLQGRHTRKQVRRFIMKDIKSWRETLELMGNFLENLKGSFERGEVKRFNFERSQFPIYEQLIAQLILLSEKELDVVHSFYEYYRTFESDVVSLCDTSKFWMDRVAAGQAIDERRKQIALFGVERAMVLRRLLLEFTSGQRLSDFRSDYKESLLGNLDEYRARVKEKHGIEFL